MSIDGLDRINDSDLPDEGKSKLEVQDLYHKHRRKNRRENSINWCFIIFVWICLISVCAIVVIKLWHMTVTANMCWLTKDQLDKLNDFFVDGSIGALVVGALKSKVIDKSDE